MTIAIANGVLREACRLAKLSPEQIRGTSRLGPISQARQAIMLALRERTQWSAPRIARWLCRKDHTTVLYGINTARARARGNPGYAALIEALRNAEPVGILEPIVAPEPEPEPEQAVTPPLIEDDPLPGFNWMRIDHGWERRVTLDDDGECWEGRLFAASMIEGSARLAKAVNQALAA